MATREEESAILVEFEDYRGAPLSHDKAPNPLVKCAFIVVAIPIMVLIYLTVHGSAVSNFAISAQPQGPPSFSIHRGSGSDAYFATMQANTQRPPMRLANVGDGALADPLYGMEVSLQQQVMERLREASHAIEASKLHATQEAQIWLANIHAQVTAAMGQLASTSSDLTSRLSEVQNLLMVVQDNIASHVDQVLSSSPQLAAAQTAVASAMDSLMMRAQIIADNPHAMAARAAAAGAVADVQPQLTALREMLSSAVYSVRVYMGAHPWVAPALMGFVVAVATVMYLRGRRNDQSEQEWGPSLLRQASRLSPWKIFAHLRHVLVSALLLPVHFVMRLVRTIAPVRTTGIVNDSYISNVDFCTPHEAPFLPRSSSALASQAQPRPLIAATQGRDARHASPRRMHAAPATAPKTAEKVYDAAEQSEDDVDGALPLVDQLPMVEAALQDVIEELHSAAVEVVDEIEAAVEPEAASQASQPAMTDTNAVADAKDKEIHELIAARDRKIEDLEKKLGEMTTLQEALKARDQAYANQQMEWIEEKQDIISEFDEQLSNLVQKIDHEKHELLVHFEDERFRIVEEYELKLKLMAEQPGKRLEGQRSRLNAEVQELTRQVETAAQLQREDGLVIKGLKEQISNLVTEFNLEKKNLVAEYEAERSQLIKGYEEKLQMVEDEQETSKNPIIEEKDQLIHSLENQQSKLNDEVRELEQQLEAANEMEHTKSEMMRKFEKQMSNLIKEKKQMIAEHENQCSQLVRTHTAELQAATDQRAKQLQLAHEQDSLISDLQDQRSQLSDQVQELTQDLEEVKRLEQAKGRMIDNFEMEMSKLVEESNEEMEQMIDKYESQRSQLVEHYDAKILRLEEQQTGHSQWAQEKNQQIRELEQQRQQLHSDVQRLNRQVAELKGREDTKRKQTRALEQQVWDLGKEKQQVISEYKNERAQLVKEYAGKLRSKEDQLTNNMHDVEEKNNAYFQYLESQRSQLIDQVEELQQKVDRAFQEHATADLSRTAQLLNTALDPNAAAEPEVVSPEDNSGAQDQVSGAPEIPPAPAEPKPAPFLTVSMQREAAVQDLMAAIQQLNHKLGSASPATRERFTKLIQRVVQFNPEPRTVAAMRGTKWELLYADTPSVYALTGINGLSTIDRMTQEISDKTMTTIIECGVADYLHPITDVFGTSHDYAEIQVTMNYGAAGNSHSVTQTLRSASFKPKKVFGQAFAIPSIPMPVPLQLPFGKFEVLYIDRALRITRTPAGHLQVDRAL